MDVLGVYLLISLFSSLITAGIGLYVAKEKGRSEIEGALFGFFFSLLGVIVVACLPAKEIKKKPNKASVGLEAWPHDDPVSSHHPSCEELSDDEVMKYLDD